MKYDFDKVVERRNTNCAKWDMAKENELPMWVADMDFEAAPPIIEALKNKVEQKVFGYNILPDAWYNAYISWWQRRHGVKYEKDWLIYSTGVISSLSSIVRKLTTPAEKVVFNTPVYNNFYTSVIDNGRRVVENELIYKDGKYSIDFEDLEKKLADPETTMMVICNPQNPAGKLWSKEELSKIARLCIDNNVLIVSDEIHCDVAIPGKAYTPFISVSEEAKNNSITLVAPTKCFNIAGIQTSAIVVPNKNLFNRVKRGLNTDECASPNTFAIDTAIAAFDKCEDWLDEMNAYVAENKKIVYDFVEKEIPNVKAVKSEGTYLVWLDCNGALETDAKEFCAFLREKEGLFVIAGGNYGKGGEKFIRMNLACPKSLVYEGLNRLKRGFEEFGK